MTYLLCNNQAEYIPRTNAAPTVGKINALCANWMPASLLTSAASPARMIPSEILANARILLDLLLEGCEMMVRMLRRMMVTPDATKKYVNWYNLLVGVRLLVRREREHTISLKAFWLFLNCSVGSIIMIVVSPSFSGGSIPKFSKIDSWISAKSLFVSWICSSDWKVALPILEIISFPSSNASVLSSLEKFSKMGVTRFVYRDASAALVVPLKDSWAERRVSLVVLSGD